MKIITISNPKADIAGCSMTVGVGSQNDLIDTLGIAHFLEHMLFIGTEEYPDENEFMKYIKDHNGSYNAATSDEHTVFYYTINPKHLEDSLKRFSGFFKYPLLKEDSIKREILAVDSEYQMKLKNDDRRIYQMINNCIQDKYVSRRFSCGNKMTLDKEGIRNILVNFYENNYSANKMCLVIYGKESNDTLFNYAVNYFNEVKSISDNNIDTSCSFGFNQIFKPEFIGKIIKIKPIGELSDLIITIALPSEYTIYYKFHVYGFISYILKKENKGSLIHKLKTEGYIFSLSSSWDSSKSYCSYSIRFSLTQKGLNNYLKILEILETFIKDKIYSTDENSFSFEEYKKLNILCRKEFAYKENEDPISLCKRLGKIAMSNIDAEHLLDYGYLLSHYNKPLLISILNTLSDRKNWLIFLVSESMFNKSSAREEKEKYYDISYKVDDEQLIVSNYSFIFEYNDIINSYEGLEILEDDILPTPIELPDSEIDYEIANGKLKYVFTNNYKTPKSCIYVLFKSQTNIAIQSVFCDLVKDVFKTTTEYYNFFFSYNFLRLKKGLRLYFYGFDSDILQIIKLFIDIMKHESFSEESFNRIKNSLIKNIKMHLFTYPSNRVFDGADMIYIPNHISFEDMLVQLNELTFNDMINYKREFYVEMLVCGNLLFKKASDLFSYICNSFKADNIVIPTIKINDECKNPVIVTSHGHSDNAYGVFYRIGELKNYKLTALARVITNHASNRFFDTLRTKESFGYIVSCQVRPILSNLFIVFLVQSQRKNEEINERINLFFEELLNNITIEDFEVSKNAVIGDLEIKYKSLNGLGNFLWGMKMNEYWDLNYHENMIKSVKELKFEDINEIRSIKNILRVYVEPEKND
ncbi:A-factor-processing enzyme [Astathelohania contejeani]|uniref:A-factor-processing enzyme n=1 Tax=Astathelohania contejeani TaxID=164912 RepID=A0ABQ7HW90_9MICR|nr:A-factor-processing enzyme [Thelohania contejeani]